MLSSSSRRAAKHAVEAVAAESTCLTVAGSQLVSEFTPSESGDHYLYVDMCDGFGCGFNVELSLTLTDPRSGQTQTIQEWNTLTNLPDSMSGAARSLSAGVAYKVHFVLEGLPSGHDPKVYVAGPDAARRTTLTSRLGSSIDYYMSFSGVPTLDGAIRGYRAVTGAAPLYGKYAYGFWQCKEHYQHQAELLDAAATFRKLQIPIDAIVQDVPPTPTRTLLVH
jgi:alpha-D-xyloside xylohydrolase